jgi:hypothetical protein
MIGGFEFANKSVDIYSKAIIKSQSDRYIQAEHKDNNIYGPVISKSIYVNDSAEAQRYAKGILRSYNKFMITGKFITELKTSFAAGSIINIKGVGMFDGKYFVHRIVHDLIRNRTEFLVRKPLEGY